MPRVLWTALLISIPLIYNPVSRWQYEPDKAALLLVLTGLLLGWSIAHGITLNFSRAEKWIAAFIFVNLLATATSIMPHWSLWGDSAWRNGLLMLVVGGVLFGLARRQLNKFYTLAIDAIVLASALLAIYGLFEKAGHAFITTDEDPVRVSSMMAHANFLAAFLAMTIPLAIARLIMTRRWWFGVALCLQVTTLAFTYSRAGWLATMVGLGVMGIMGCWLHKHKRLAIWLSACMVGGFIGLLGLSMLPPLPGTAPHSLQTLTSLFRWKGATAQIRLIGWEASLEALVERPVLGYGPSTFRLVIEHVAPPELAHYGGTEALGGRAHNFALEVILGSGIVGFVIYICMVGAVLVPIMLSDKQSMLQTALLCGLVANLASNFFSFDAIPNWMLFWVFAGLAHAQIDQPIGSNIRSVRTGKAIAFGSLALAIWLITPDILAFRAEEYCADRPSCDSVELLECASELSPTPEMLQILLGHVYAREALRTQDEYYWRRSADLYRSLTHSFPNVVRFWKVQALNYRRWYMLSRNPAHADAAIHAYSKAIGLSNRDPDLWIDRGLTYIAIDNTELAYIDIHWAGQLLDDYPRYYGAMSIYFAQVGYIETAKEWQERHMTWQQHWNDIKWRR